MPGNFLVSEMKERIRNRNAPWNLTSGRGRRQRKTISAGEKAGVRDRECWACGRGRFSIFYKVTRKVFLRKYLDTDLREMMEPVVRIPE